MAFSHGYGQIPSKEYAIEAIKDAYAHGCTFFDTAEGYGSRLYYEHHNEEILGEVLKEVRKNVVLPLKCILKIGEKGNNPLPFIFSMNL